MEQPFRMRFMNSVLLTGVLLMYVLYDTGFRFWMAQSDSAALNAAIVRDTTFLKRNGEPAITFEASLEATASPSLQSFLQEGGQWTRVRDDSNDDAPRQDAPSLSDLPMAAVIVESTWLSPDGSAVSASYAQRLLEGFRYAVLTGSPWLLLVGSEEETAVALQHLRRLPNPAGALFGDAAMRRWPAEFQRYVDPIRDSMRDYHTLGQWMRGVTTRLVPSFAASSLPQTSPTTTSSFSARGTAAESVSAAPPTDQLHFHRYHHATALRASLNHLLSVNALTSTDSHAHRSCPPALILATEWLSRSDAALIEKNEKALKAEHWLPSRVVLHATSTNAYDADTDDTRSSPSRGGAATAAIADTTTRTEKGEEGGRGFPLGVSASWESPRVLELALNFTHRRVHVTLPGIVTVTVADANQRARGVAKALQQLLEKTLVQRHAVITSASTSRADSPDGWWWWLGRPYGLTVVGGRWEQQRIKLLYLKALREATADTQEGLRRAVQDVHKTRCQFEAGNEVSALSRLLCGGGGGRTSRGGGRGLLPTVLPFTAAVPSLPKVYVLPPAWEEVPLPERQPEWLNYTGELPLEMNPHASYAARIIGRWSYFIYDNYRQWVNWFLASLPSGAYQDHFMLASVLLSDLADHRISLRDFLYAR